MADAKRVVCIEDDWQVIDLIKIILEREGFELIGAMGGREGLETVRRVKPDLVLLDLMMPDINGWEVYRQMKADQALKNIPVILVTAVDRPLTGMLGLTHSEVDDFIVKPFDAEDLVRRIEKVLGSR